RDHRGLRFRGARAGMSGQAFVAVDVDLVAVDGMRDHWRLFGIVAYLLFRRVAGLRHRARRTLVVERSWAAQRGIQRLRRERAGAGRDRGRKEDDRRCSARFADRALLQGRYTFSMRTAHFLKSACSEIGSVASSVTLLMSLDSSNQGTKTRPRGGRSRPRVSRRARTKPRREITFTSSQRLSFASCASSGCMKQTASGNAR